MATQRKDILLLAADLRSLGNIFCRLAHAVRVVHGRQAGIDETPAQCRILQVHSATKGAVGLAQYKRRACHTLHAASDKSIARTGLNGLRRAIDGLQS